MDLKKVLTYLTDFIIAGIVIFWGYQLYTEFSALSQSPENARNFSIFTIKVLLFGLFIIISVTTVFYLNMMENRRRSPFIMNAAYDRDLLRRLEEKLDMIGKPLINEKPPQGLSRNDEEKPQPLKTSTYIPEYDWYSRILKAVNKGELLNSFLDILNKCVRASRISVITGDSNTGVYTIAGGRGLPFEMHKASQPHVASEAIKRDKRYFVTNIETHPEFNRHNLPGYKNLSFMILPFRILQQSLSIAVCITEKESGEVFNSRDLDIAQYISSLFILKWENLS